MPADARATRDSYRAFTPITTRWSDNDAYRHLNNAVYYAMFDTAVNEPLLRRGLLDLAASPVVGLVVESGCRYHASLGFPDRIEAGLAVGRLGTSSVRYEVALFREGENGAAAEGHFVHVHVDRETGRPVPIPAATRAYLETLAV